MNDIFTPLALGLIILWLGVRSYRLYKGLRSNHVQNTQFVKGLLYLALAWIGMISASLHYLSK